MRRNGKPSWSHILSRKDIRLKKEVSEKKFQIQLVSEFFQTYKKEIISFLHKLFQRMILKLYF